VALGNPAGLDVTGAVTLSAWIKPEATDGIRNILVHGHSPSPAGEVCLRINNGQYQVGSWNGSDHKTTYAIPAEDIGTWVHLAGLYDAAAGQWRLYRNGQLVATAAESTGAVSVAEDWAIAARGTGTERFFQGAIDEVRLYDRPLTPDEINVLAETATGPVTQLDYDNLGRLTSQVDALGGTTAYTYDLAGNRLSLTDPVGNTTSWAYDDLDRQVQETNELGDVRYFHYDAAGRLVRGVDRLGRVREFHFDNLSRNTAEIWYNTETDADADQNRQNTLSFTYDLAGQRLTASDAAASYGYAYDDLGRVTSIDQQIAGLTPVVTFAQQFDALGRRTQLAATIGGTADFLTNYAYDNVGRIAAITQQGQTGGKAVAEKAVDFAFDLAGQPRGIERFADIGRTQPVARTDYLFDLAGRVTDLTHTNGATTFADYDLAWDAAGRITDFDFASLVGGSGDADYSYDDTNQLTGSDYTGDWQADEDYVYDENGNRVTANGSAYVTGPNNQLLSDGTHRYLYDAEGNRRFRFVDNDSSGDLTAGDTAITEFVWDHRNRLVAVKDFADHTAYAAGAPSQVVEHTYDFGNRWTRKVFNPGQPDERATIFVYDGNQIILRADGTGDLSHRYLWGPAVDQILADEQVHWDSGSSDYVTDDVLWTLTDHLNTVRDLIDNSANVDNHLTYDSYGQVTSETNSNVDTLFLFTARPYDPDSVLQYNSARWYDLAAGRWISPDPIQADINLYRYCANDPLRNRDPSGLEWEVERDSSERRAVACNSDPKDTVADLAAKIRLNADEWKRWLEAADDGVRWRRIAGHSKCLVLLLN